MDQFLIIMAVTALILLATMVVFLILLYLEVRGLLPPPRNDPRWMKEAQETGNWGESTILRDLRKMQIPLSPIEELAAAVKKPRKKRKTAS